MKCDTQLFVLLFMFALRTAWEDHAFGDRAAFGTGLNTLLSCQVSVSGYRDKHYTITDTSGTCMNEEKTKRRPNSFSPKNLAWGVYWLDANVTLVSCDEAEIVAWEVTAERDITNPCLANMGLSVEDRQRAYLSLSVPKIGLGRDYLAQRDGSRVPFPHT